MSFRLRDWPTVAVNAGRYHESCRTPDAGAPHSPNWYEPGHKDEPDLLWDLDLYSRLDLADAWAIIGPVNWYGPTSNLKLLFDRLVCASGGSPREDLIDHKDPENAMALEHSPERGA